MPNFFFLLAIIIFSQSRLQFWWGRREGYVKRGSPDAFLKWGSGPQPRRAKRSRAGDDRGVKEMAVNNKVAAAGRPLHPRQREPNLRVLRRGEVLSNMHGQGQALQSFHLFVSIRAMLSYDLDHMMEFLA